MGACVRASMVEASIHLTRAFHFHRKKKWLLPPARLAQSEEHGTLNSRVVGLSPTLGATLL